MSPLEERFTVVILCKGRVVRLLGRGYSLSLALALLAFGRPGAGAGRRAGACAAVDCAAVDRLGCRGRHAAA